LRREKESGLFIPITTLKEIIKLCDYFLGNQVFPLKAVNLLDELIAYKLNHSFQSDLLMPSDVDEFFSHKYNIPAGAVGDQEQKILLNLEDRLHEGLVNQTVALQELANALRRTPCRIKKTIPSYWKFLIFRSYWLWQN